MKFSSTLLLYSLTAIVLAGSFLYWQPDTVTIPEFERSMSILDCFPVEYHIDLNSDKYKHMQDAMSQCWFLWFVSHVVESYRRINTLSLNRGSTFCFPLSRIYCPRRRAQGIIIYPADWRCTKHVGFVGFSEVGWRWWSVITTKMISIFLFCRPLWMLLLSCSSVSFLIPSLSTPRSSSHPFRKTSRDDGRRSWSRMSLRPLWSQRSTPWWRRRESASTPSSSTSETIVGVREMSDAEWDVVRELVPHYSLRVRQYVVMSPAKLSPVFKDVREMKNLFRQSGYTYSRIGSETTVRVFMKDE